MEEGKEKLVGRNKEVVTFISRIIKEGLENCNKLK